MSFSEFVMLIAASVSDIGRTLRETIGDMRSLFSTLDPDGDGSISGEEVAFGLRALCGHNHVTDEMAQEWIMNIDEDGDGELDFSEFARMMAVGHVVPDTEAEEARKRAREEAERVVTGVLDIRVDLRSKQHASQLCKGLEGMGCKSIQDALGLEVPTLEPPWPPHSASSFPLRKTWPKRSRET